MTLEAKFLDYDFDEEKNAFGEPEHPTEPPKPMSIAARIGGVLAAVGLIALVIQLSAGTAEILGHGPFDLGLVSTGTWTGLVASFGLLLAGGFLYYPTVYAAKTAGIHNDSNFFATSRTRSWFTWILAVAISLFYILLYFYWDIRSATGSDTDWLAPMIEITKPFAIAFYGEEAYVKEGVSNRWFLYGFLYTTSMLLFGVRFAFRYRHNRYQLLRTGALITAQVLFGFLLPYILKAFNEPSHYFTYFWPLKPEYLYPSNLMGGYYEKARWMLYFSMGMTFLATPALTYMVGKRWYCSWVCGCGGLAETVGDQWRQMSVKKDWAWKVERYSIHSVLVIVIVGTAILWLNASNEGGQITSEGLLGVPAAQYSKWYGFIIVSGFSGLAGVGLYPLLGARIWCRFGCPMAAILGLFQKTASRFRITTNGGQCMSCGNCSTYCEMGIDVRAYAQRGDNIVRASCVGCGVCSAVCPRGVLKLENGKNDETRYNGVTANPVTNFINIATKTPSKNGEFVGWLKENDTVTQGKD